ncbi:MAG: hypothetical protein Q9173_001915 [Seirophora scorigena]
MAEVGVAASILSIAAIGTSLAMTLYEQADILLHARQEITSMAKHVSRFTAVLKHTSQVLDAEKENCSKEMLRDIRRIKHSCIKTFKEINSTIQSKRSRFLESFKWMFKKAKARELEARLESLQSMLQCMIHTLTVSKLGKMDSRLVGSPRVLGPRVNEPNRSREDSHHISDLSSEIKLLKTLIIENRSNLEELRLAEQDSGAQDTHDSGKNIHVRTLDGHVPYPQEQEPQSAFKRPRSPRGRSYSPNPLHSETEYSEAEKGDEEVSDLEGKDPEDKIDPHRTDNDARKVNAIQERSTQPPPPYRGPSETSMHRESNLLLQMVPHASRILNPRSPQYLLTGTQGPDNDVKSGMQEATSNIRLLLDKWTNPGSAPIADLLAQEAAEDAEREVELRLDSTVNAHLAPRQRVTTAEDDPYYDSDYNVLDDNPPIYWPGPHYKSRSMGDDILKYLRSRRAGIVYTKRNNFQQFHYVDHECFYIYHLVPGHMMQSREVQYTELGQGLVKKEALDLLGYSY